MSFDFVDYKKDFPLLMQQDIAYLDSAATAQRPASVLQAEKEFYEQANANPLRGLYELGVEATDRYEAARERVRKFLNARSDAEIIFTRNTTESCPVQSRCSNPEIPRGQCQCGSAGSRCSICARSRSGGRRDRCG